MSKVDFSRQEILEFSEELKNLIELDTYILNNFDEHKIDYYMTALNLLKAGYHK